VIWVWDLTVHKASKGFDVLDLGSVKDCVHETVVELHTPLGPSVQVSLLGVLEIVLQLVRYFVFSRHSDVVTILGDQL